MIAGECRTSLPSIRLLVRTGSHLGSFAAADMTRRRAKRSGQPFSVNANKYRSTAQRPRAPTSTTQQSTDHTHPTESGLPNAKMLAKIRAR
jgi:hypothetical protein